MRPRPLAVLATLALVLVPAAQEAPGPRPPSSSVLGTWDGSYEPPGVVGGDPCSLVLERGPDDGLRATLVLTERTAELTGRFDAERGRLVLVGAEGRGGLELRLEDAKLVGTGHEGARVSGFRLAHTSPEALPREHRRSVVDLAARPLPARTVRAGLPEALDTRLDALLRRTAEEARIVGLAVACVLDGEVADVRVLGWEDLLAGVPVWAETRFRWASISKPLTATTALRLAARGRFDLDADLRSWVPEFPDPGARLTPRLVLCHQSGIVHYDGAVRTWRSYPEEHPFERLENGLDLFRASPLLAPPGTRFSYSTHAWTLLGVALERAAEQPFAALVRAQVLDPLRLATLEPDFPSRAIPHRSKGYERDGERLVETLEDDVSWKLPGGGWLSTVEDLAGFGAGLLGDALLDGDQKKAAWTAQKVADGTPTNVGLGFFLGRLDGKRFVSHSGGQRKAAAYLGLLPDERLAVAVMTNTAGAPVADLAREILRLLVAR